MRDDERPGVKYREFESIKMYQIMLSYSVWYYKVHSHVGLGNGNFKMGTGFAVFFHVYHDISFDLPF